MSRAQTADDCSSLKNAIPHQAHDFFFTRRNGVVCPNEETDNDAANYLRQVQRDMTRENEIAQRVAQCSRRIIAPMEDLNAVKIILNGESYEAGGSFFLVMEQLTSNDFDDKNSKGWFVKDLLQECSLPPDKSSPLRNGGLPSPYTMACVMEELLKPLRDIHNSGFLHGDIQDGNFFLAGHDLSFGDIGIGTILDFGNARELLEDNKTAPITDKRIYGTEGFCSPEIIFDNDGTLQLTPASDIFSAGCFFLYLIMGNEFKENWGKELVSSFTMTLPVSEQELLKRGFRKSAAVAAEKILTKALDFEPAFRYQNAGEMLTDILALKKLTLPPGFQLAENLEQDFFWVEGSRDAELAELQKAMHKSAPIYIWGLWGVGKTSLAVQFALRQKERGVGAYMVKFCNTIKETVLQMDFANYNFVFDGIGDAREKEYRERLNILRTDYKDCLLIIDGFEREDTLMSELQQESAYNDLIKSGLHIIFTTRFRPNQYAPELESLNEESAFRLYQKITCGSDKENFHPFTSAEEKIIRNLLREVDYHTLTVELLASLVNGSWQELTPQQLLAEFKNHRLSATDKSAIIYERVRTLFNLCKFDETYREIFCHVIFLPREGFDAAIWMNSEEPVKKKQVRLIESQGWIRRRRDNNRLQIHSLIRKLFKDVFKPTDADCDKFFSRLWEHFEDQYPPDIELFRQAAELYERAGDELQDPRGDYSTHAGYSFVIIGKSPRALLNENRAIRIRETSGNDDIARNYNDKACVCLKLASEEEALTYLEKARKLLESQSPIKPELATVYSNLGVVYLKLNHDKEALRYSRQAVELFRKNPPKNRFEFACALTTLGKALENKKTYAEAADCFQEAADTLEEILPPDHLDLATAYLNLSDIFYALTDKNKALAFGLKALNIREHCLPENHHDLMSTWSLLGEIYRSMGEPDKSKFYFDKVSQAFAKSQEKSAAEMLRENFDLLETKKILVARNLETPAGISTVCRHIADNYLTLKDFAGARKYIDLAISTMSDAEQSHIEYRTEELLSKQRVLNFLSAADIYDADNETETALDFVQKALVVAQTAPNDFIQQGLCCQKLAILCRKLNRNEEALSYHKKYIEIELKRAHPRRDGIQLAKFCIGMILSDLGRTDEAIKLLEEVRADMTKTLPDFHHDVQDMDAIIGKLKEK